MIEITDKRDCCGCSACAQICPQQCITMSEDGEGYSYPRVDKQACIGCGLCERVCPVMDPCEPVVPKVVYAAKNRDERVRLQSSSGGIFTPLAERVIGEGGVVFGAQFDQEWRVVHSHTESVEGLAPMRGSKYVQSVIGRSYKLAEAFLKEGRKVLFCGTPCQIAGLNHFLRREYDNLLTVEVVCHGVPSPKVWREYLLERVGNVANNPAGLISDISFRDKSAGWEEYGVRVGYAQQAASPQNGGIKGIGDTTTRSEVTHHKEDPFMRSFLKDLNLRPSCYRCAARQGRSQADIALADYWGVRSLHEEIYDTKGVGLVILNSHKGVEYYNSICEEVEQCPSDYNRAIEHNPCIVRSVAQPKRREDFWGLYDTHKMGAVGIVSKRVSAPLLLHRWRRRVRHLLK